jgi:transposase
VLHTAARQKKAMNQGHWMRAFAFRLTAVARDSGTIHRARANLTVVPTRSAAGAAHHCEGDRQQVVKEATASSADYFVQIHSKPQANDRELQQ